MNRKLIAAALAAAIFMSGCAKKRDRSEYVKESTQNTPAASAEELGNPALPEDTASAEAILLTEKDSDAIAPSENSYGAVFTMTADELLEKINAVWKDMHGNELISEWMRSSKEEDTNGVLYTSYYFREDIRALTEATINISVEEESGLIRSILIHCDMENIGKNKKAVYGEFVKAVIRAMIPELDDTAAEALLQDLYANMYEFDLEGPKPVYFFRENKSISYRKLGLNTVSIEPLTNEKKALNESIGYTYRNID
ncbi:MAG: hypothetical protein J6D00_04230 [Christensenellaceae bacterium]|nr:hypothetical protein [Christensenellaceae bacterium]